MLTFRNDYGSLHVRGGPDEYECVAEPAPDWWMWKDSPADKPPRLRFRITWQEARLASDGYRLRGRPDGIRFYLTHEKEVEVTGPTHYQASCRVPRREWFRLFDLENRKRYPEVPGAEE